MNIKLLSQKSVTTTTTTEKTASASKSLKVRTDLRAGGAVYLDIDYGS